MIQAAIAFVLAATAARPVTLVSLLAEMSDRAALSELPSPGYKQVEATSYDRKSTDPKDAKTWFANQDYGQFIRTEQHDGRTEWVVMEHSGPGAITRIWTPIDPSKDKMLVRFYFDGSKTPGIEEPFNDFMRGKRFVKPPFAFVSWPEPGVDSNVGADCYLPIPFARSCKVTLSEIPFYYSFTYRAYPGGTQVQTFSRKVFDSAASKLENVARDLAFPVILAGHGANSVSARVAAGSSKSLELTRGSREVDGIQLKVPDDLDPQELRSVVVEMTFDGERTVWSPIGSFFGCGVQMRPVWDRYRRVLANGTMNCVWCMPYRRSASIRLINLGSKPLDATITAFTSPRRWNERTMHFHATWHDQYPLASRPMSDWNYVTAHGQGLYVGDTLGVMSPVAAWYGEGDEKVYVDGERFPSHFGTGTEDYYGYAWGMAEHYSSPYLAMPLRDQPGRGNWTGIVTTSRVRGLDAIPFEKTIRFDMEVWDWADTKLSYSETSFWYARPGATSNRAPDPSAASRKLPEWGTKGAVECEMMRVVGKSDGVAVETQDGGLSEGSWSGGAQLFLKFTAPKQYVELGFSVDKAGIYHVVLYGTKSYDYGFCRFTLNGTGVGQADLWSAKPIPSGPLDFGVCQMKKGQNVLRVDVSGTDENSTGARYYCGLDYLLLQPQQPPSR